MYLYDNLQKFITLDKYNVQKGPHHITAINYIDRQQTPSATAIAIAIAAQGVQSLTFDNAVHDYGSQQKQQYKKFTLLSEYFYRKPRVLTINDKIKTICDNTFKSLFNTNANANANARKCTDIVDPYSGTSVEEYGQKTAGGKATSIFPPENNNNYTLFFLKISLFLGMTSASCYFLYFGGKRRHYTKA